MVEKKKFGSGITQRVDSVIGSETAMEEDMREWKKSTDAVNDYRRKGGHVAHIEARATAIMAQAKEPIQDQSHEWYAKEALIKLDFMRQFVARGDTAEALNFAVALGALWKEAEMKFQWERFALVGEKVVEHGSGGHGVTVYDALEALQWAESTYPDTGKTQQKKKAADKVGLGKSQFYNLIKK